MPKTLTWEDCLPDTQSVLTRVIHHCRATDPSLSPIYLMATVYPIMGHFFTVSRCKIKMRYGKPPTPPKIWSFLLGPPASGKTEAMKHIRELYATVLEVVEQETGEQLRPETKPAALAAGHGRTPLLEAEGTHHGVTAALGNEDTKSGCVYWNESLQRTLAVLFNWEAAAFLSKDHVHDVLCKFFDEHGAVGKTQKDFDNQRDRDIKRPLLQALFATTPGAWKSITRETDLRTGLYSRMIFFVETDEYESPIFDDDPGFDEVTHTYLETEKEQLIRDWIDIYKGVSIQGGDLDDEGFVQVDFNAEAREVMRAYTKKVRTKKAKAIEAGDEALAAQWDRTIQHAFAVAGVNALSRNSVCVSAQDATAATNMLILAMRFFDGASQAVVANQFEALLAKAMAALEKAGEEGLQPSLVRRAMGTIPDKQAEEVLKTLQNRGDILLTKRTKPAKQGQKRRGRPSQRYVHSHFATLAGATTH